MSLASPAVSPRARDTDIQKGPSGGKGAATALLSSSVVRELLLAKMQTMTSDLVSSVGAKNPAAKTSGKKQVEDVIRDLEEWNAKWFEELITKVKGELAQPPSRSSPTAEASTPRYMKYYQPTIEDIHTTEDEFELGRRSCLKTKARISGPSAAPAPSTTISSPQRTRPNSPSSSSQMTSPRSSTSPASSPSSPVSNYSYGKTPLHSRPNSPSANSTTTVSYQLVKPSQPRPSVRFSDREAPAPTTTTQTTTYRLRESGGGDGTSSAVDAKWGRLFNEQGEPTPALGRLLRGIANYIIAEYSPRDSLVITPDQLYKFYTKYKVEGEVFPFLRIFDTRYHRTTKGLEFLYLDLRCDHHLIPSPASPRPHLPALTPSGFQDWMTLFLRASPDQEARRLDLIARDLPIVADAPGPHGGKGKPERLPRQIPRHLFPERRHTKAHALVASSLEEWRCVASSSACTSASSSPARRDRDERYRERDGAKAGGPSFRGLRPVRGREREPGRHTDLYVRSREPSPPGVAERTHRKR